MASFLAKWKAARKRTRVTVALLIGLIIAGIWFIPSLGRSLVPQQVLMTKITETNCCGAQAYFVEFFEAGPKKVAMVLLITYSEYYVEPGKEIYVNLFLEEGTQLATLSLEFNCLGISFHILRWNATRGILSPQLLAEQRHVAFSFQGIEGGSHGLGLWLEFFPGIDRADVTVSMTLQPATMLALYHQTGEAHLSVEVPATPPTG